MAETTPRQRARLETEAQITRIGNLMVDEDGVEKLSLRAIARELGVVSSAVYRYVRSRDELLTILIRDAFNQVADAVDEALAGESGVETIGLTMLRWSQSHPNRWALIYGTPIAEYEAPREQTVVPGTRIMVTLAECVAESMKSSESKGSPESKKRSDSLRNPESLKSSASSVQEPAVPSAQALRPLREGLEEQGVHHSDAVIMRTVTIWVAIIGLINSLRFGQFGPGFDGLEDELMRGLIAALA